MRKVITVILFLSFNILYSQNSTIYSNANFNSAVDFICKNNSGNTTHGGLTHELIGEYPFFQTAMCGLLFQTNASGEVVWAKTFTGCKFLKCVPANAENAFFALGMSLEDITFFVAKFKDDGTLLWSKSIDNGDGYSIELSDMIIEPQSGDIYLCGAQYDDDASGLLLGVNAQNGTYINGKSVLFNNLKTNISSISQSNGNLFLLSQSTSSNISIVKMDKNNQVTGSDYQVAYAHSGNLSIHLGSLNDINNANEQVITFTIEKGGRTPKGIGFFSLRSDNLVLGSAFQPKFMVLEKDDEPIDIQNMRSEKIDEQSIGFISSFSDGPFNFDLAFSKLSSLLANKNTIDFAKEIGEDGNDLYKGGVKYSFDIEKDANNILIDMTREIEVSPGIKTFSVVSEQHLNSSSLNCMEKKLEGSLDPLSVTSRALTITADFNNVFTQHNLTLIAKNISLGEQSSSCCSNAVNLIPDGNFEYRFYDTTKYKTDYSYTMNAISLIPGKFTIENNQTKYAGGQHECFPAGLPALIKNHGYFLNIDSRNDLPIFWSKTVAVQPNMVYKLSVDLLNRFISDDDYHIQLYINDQLIDNIVLRIWSYCGWDTYSLNINSGNNTSLKIEFRESSSLEANANDFSLDNISLIQNGCAGIACNQRILSSEELETAHNDELGDGLLLYPNPSHGIVQLKSSSTTEISGFQLFNQTGAEVTTKIQFEDMKSFKIDMSNYPSGVYLFKYLENGQPKAKKIVLM